MTLLMTDEPQISERERDILRLVATGATNKQIANDLNITVNTVKVHLRNIFGKIGVVSRTEATLYAVRVGLVEVDRDQRLADEGSPLAPTTVVVPDDPAEPPESEPLPYVMEQQPEAVVSPTPNERSTSIIVVPQPQTEPRPTPTTEAISETPTVPSPAPASNQRPLLLALGVLIVVVLALGSMLLMRPASAPVAAPPELPAENERWRTLTPMPAARSAFALTGFRFDGSNYFYLIGGEGENSVHGDVLRYDPAGNVWVSFRAKPTPVADIQAAVVGGRIFVPGGRTADGTISDALEVYDPQRDSWETLANLPEPRSRYGLSAAEGKIYLFGGWDGSAYQANVWQYSPDSDEWLVLSPMDIPRADHGAVAIDGLIYVVGGRNDSGELSLNQRYNPTEEGIDNPWTLRAPMPVARANVAVSAVALDRIFVIGGDNEPVGISYNATLDVWQTVEDLPLEPGLSGVRSQSSGGELFIFGGRNDSGLLRQVYAYLAIYTYLVPPT